MEGNNTNYEKIGLASIFSGNFKILRDTLKEGLQFNHTPRHLNSIRSFGMTGGDFGTDSSLPSFG